MPHSLKMYKFTSEHWWNLKASNIYFTNYEASIISNHFTLPLHISALELRSIHHPHRCFWENGLRARHSWPKIKDVSRGACKSRMEENLWSSVSTTLYSPQFCKIIGILYPLLWASGRSWLRLACGCQPATHQSWNCVITPWTVSGISLQNILPTARTKPKWCPHHFILSF